MRITKVFFLLCICLSSASGVWAQGPVLDTLLRKFNQHRETTLQEKIYAHLDRNFYLTGETLWFKVYTVDGTLHKPVDVSKVAYVEILDKANFPVLQAKIKLENGSGHGSFFLPASLSSAHYKFRVYTSWMKNFSPEFYFDQPFSIVNPFITPEQPQAKNGKSYSVAFFPEGGNLVSGLKSKVAFRIADETGKGAACKGMILNSRGDTVAAFTPLKFGIGNFWFTPSESENYRAILVDPNGRKHDQAFPKIFPSGYVLQLRDSGEFIHALVTSKGVEDGAVYLFVHARQIIAQTTGQNIRNNQASFLIAKKDIADGISHFTLFNHELEPLCERLYFTFPQKQLDIALDGNQKIFSTRKKVAISLQTKASGQPVAANLSMSVYRVDSLQAANATSIYPYLWLNSDLTGEVESADYYFNPAVKGAAVAMDNLMLTHGWRRFDWKTVLGGKHTYTFLPEASEHIIEGTISKDGKPSPATFTYLGTPGKIIRAYGSWSNARGEVRFEIKDFYGPRRIIVQAQSDSSESYDLKILSPFSDRFDAHELPGLHLKENLAEEILARSIAMQVQDIYYYEDFANRIIAPVIDSTAFYGKADATFYLDDYTRFPVMEEVMREYVPGVFVRKRRDGFHFVLVDYVHGGVLSGNPMVLLDGVPVLDVDDIMSMDPLRVKKLEVVKRQYFLGQSAFSGIVSYTTYHGDLGGMEFDPKTLSLNYDGLQLRREFYSPQYPAQQNSERMPDQRYLLHWQPVITTNGSGKAQVEFFTSDVPGQYVVVVEGLSQQGDAGSKQYTFTVETPENP